MGSTTIRLDAEGFPIRVDADKGWTAPSLPGLEFPGCTPRRVKRSEIDAYEGRIEFWDADAETAWVCEPATPVHERPSRALAALAERIAAVRGSPVTCFGSMDLLLRDGDGAPRRILEADESLYLHPLSANLPGSAAMVVGEHDFPDVVLEVDHTTDARQGKLKLYEAWGFPEVWIQVPAEPAPSRPRSRLPGLTIYLLEGGVYRVSGESRAFPGWTAENIHAALDEKAPTAATLETIERVGLELGAREGTGPDDDPMLRSQRRQAMRQGIEQGIERGLTAQREILRRQAERKFGSTAAAEFVRRLETVTDPSRLAEAGERIIDCETGDDLLAQQPSE